jgi:hypothetical protein
LSESLHRERLDNFSERWIALNERREDDWRIAHRVVVIEWIRQFPDSLDFGDDSLFGRMRRGEPFRHDVVFGVLNEVG